MATKGYDPKKAELYNKLRKSGLGDEQAWTQAGLTDDDEIYYVANDADYNADGSKNTTKGQMGENIVGSGTKPPVLSAEEKAYRASIDAAGAGFDERLAADSARFDAPAPAPANVPKVDYPVTTRSTSNTKTVETYTTTSTEQVSGGGERTTVAGVTKANAQSSALQAQADAKTAEIKQYLADNPVNANTTPEEKAARRAKVTELSNERGKLATAAEEAKTPGNPTETIVPNTTTNTSTTTFSQSSTNSAVETIAGPDPALNQTPNLDNTQVQAAEPRQVPVQDSLAPGEELVQKDAPRQVPVQDSLAPGEE